MNRKSLVFGLIMGFLLCFSTSMTSCKTKEGCGLEDKYRADMNSDKRGKSNLFSKKQRKKMKKRGG